MKAKSLILCLLTILSFNIVNSQNIYNLESPQKNINIKITVDKDFLKYSVTHDNTVIINDSPISMELSDGKVLGANPIVRSSKTESVNEKIKADFYKKEYVENNYNELTLNFKGYYSVQFRAYDDGIAYRFCTKFPKQITITKENIIYNFNEDVYGEKVTCTFLSYIREERKFPSLKDLINQLDNDKKLIIEKCGDK